MMDVPKAEPRGVLRSARYELAAAQRIETLQIAHWRVLLSHPPSLGAIRAELSRHIALPPEFELLSEVSTEVSLRNEVVDRVSNEVHVRDSNRESLPAVDAAVERYLTRERNSLEQLAALARARIAHRRAKHELVVANLGLVRSLAKRYVGATTPFSELVQEGSIALLRAVDLFDYRRGLRFSTYAVWWIRNAFHRCISEQSSAVRAPLEVMRGASKAHRYVWTMYGQTGHMPNHEELAEHLGETAAAVERMERGNQTRTFSLDRNVDRDGSTTFLDQLVDRTPSVESLLNDAVLRQQLELSLEKLPSMEAIIIRRKFGFADGVETPLSVIARDHNLSYERALQLSRQAMRRLKLELERRGIGDVS